MNKVTSPVLRAARRRQRKNRDRRRLAERHRAFDSLNVPALDGKPLFRVNYVFSRFYDSRSEMCREIRLTVLSHLAERKDRIISSKQLTAQEAELILDKAYANWRQNPPDWTFRPEFEQNLSKLIDTLKKAYKS